MAFCAKRLTVRGTFRPPGDYCCVRAKLGPKTQQQPGFSRKGEKTQSALSDTHQESSPVSFECQRFSPSLKLSPSNFFFASFCLFPGNISAAGPNAHEITSMLVKRCKSKITEKQFEGMTPENLRTLQEQAHVQNHNFTFQ